VASLVLHPFHNGTECQIAAQGDFGSPGSFSTSDPRNLVDLVETPERSGHRQGEARKARVTPPTGVPTGPSVVEGEIKVRDFSLEKSTEKIVAPTLEFRSRSRDEVLLREEFQKIVRRYARHGVLFASRAVLVEALREQHYPLVTDYVVARLIKEDRSLLRIGDHVHRVHGTPYLLLNHRSLVSTRARISRARRMFLRLVEKRRSGAENVRGSQIRDEDPRYGGRHLPTRRAYQAKLMAHGSLPCSRCHNPVLYNKKWHLDHEDGSDLDYLGVAHPLCNMKHQLHNRVSALLAASTDPITPA
jgi:hypothetical protein